MKPFEIKGLRPLKPLSRGNLCGNYSMKASFGPLQVNLRYTYSRKGALYYQRPIPKELQPRYGKKLVKVKLKSADVLLASREVDRLNRQVEAEWERLRAEPTSSPQALRAHAVSLLRDWGLADQPAKNAPSIVEVFFDFLDGKRPNHAVEDEDQRAQPNPVEYLSPTEREAAKLLAGRVEVRLSDALEFYLNTHTKRDDAKFSADARRVFDGLMNVIGDKPFESVTRADARAFVDAELARGSATTSVRRRLSTIVAVFTRYAREHELSRPNPFAELKIMGEGNDSKERQPFTLEELQRTVARCREKDDEPRWITAMLADTGARLAEVVGLPLDDIKLDAEVPHIVIQEHPWRSLKNKDSKRVGPLVGASLWAAQRAVAGSLPGAVLAFPKYTSVKGCNANSASATIAKWLRGQGVPHTAHELRHTMADRLREVQCPEDIRKSIGGWASADVASRYGKGYSLQVMREWLLKGELS
ncbi:tyrosine-type recombinase/integrase [Pseudomonas shirazensis]|uniref:tyrosine-type recombinase/integrase n=1 Tax=Pseudomonas shirazensis TaxID=2745494 RepID=UPI0039874502